MFLELPRRLDKPLEVRGPADQPFPAALAGKNEPLARRRLPAAFAQRLPAGPGVRRATHKLLVYQWVVTHVC